MNRNKHIMGNLSLGFRWLVLTLCSCKTSHDPYVSLAELQDSLKQGGDSISFYCIKEKYAVWIHDEEEIDDTFGLPLQSLYYYDLGTKVRTKLFTTQRDSVYLLPNKSKSFMMWGIGAIASSNDSLALLINDFEGDILMIPTRKIDSVSVLVLGNHIIDLPENDDIPLEDLQAYTFSSYEASEGEYYAMEYVEIPQTNQQGYDTSWKVQKKLIYTTTGEYVRTHPQATIYLGNGKEPFEIPVEMLDDQAEVKKKSLYTSPITSMTCTPWLTMPSNSRRPSTILIPRTNCTTSLSGLMPYKRSPTWIIVTLMAIMGNDCEWMAKTSLFIQPIEVLQTYPTLIKSSFKQKSMIWKNA